MKRFKIMTGICIALFCMLAFTACGLSINNPPTDESEDSASAEDTTYTADIGGYTFTYPAALEEDIVIQTPGIDGEMLFSVSEKASIEAAQAQNMNDDGAGWLFGIGKIDEEQLHEMQCGDMSGSQVFAKDKKGNYFVYYHPTDVRLVRADNEEMDKAMEGWTALNEWAAQAPAQFILDNKGLKEYNITNSALDIYLANIAYADKTDYTISTTEFGPMDPDGTDPTNYVTPLVTGVRYEEAEVEEAPDGEYVVLEFPNDDERFDFFFADGQQNLIRRTWAGSEEYYQAIFDDDSLKATELMDDWYHAIAK